MTPEERVERIKLEVSIEQLLGVSSKNPPCPSCGKRNKFYILPGAPLCYCHSASCEFNKAKDVIGVHSWKTGKSRWEAVLDLEQEYNLATNSILPERSKLMEECLAIYQGYLWREEGRQALEYILSRGFLEETIRRYKIGYAPSFNSLRAHKVSPVLLSTQGLLVGDREIYSNRLVLPIYNQRGQLVHFTGRWVGKEVEDIPRYKETRTVAGVQGTKSFLYFEHLLAKYPQERLVVAEGFLDAMTLIQLGIPVVGLAGLEKLASHYHKLEGFKEIVFMFDNDIYPADHPKHPLEYKSWLRIIPQLVELQLVLPDTPFYICLVPNETRGVRTKDINDWCRDLTRGEVDSYIASKKQEFISTIISRWAGDFTHHLTLLRLVNKTGRGKEELARFINPSLSAVDYALSVIAA